MIKDRIPAYEAYTAEVETLARALSDCTRETWTVVPRNLDNNFHRIITEQKTDLSLTVQAYFSPSEKNRYEVRGTYGPDNRMVEHAPRLGNVPKITISRDKNPAQVARDIARRIVPQFRPLWEQCKANFLQSKTTDAGMDRLFIKLCRTIGAEPVEHERARRQLNYSFDDKGYLQLQATSPTTARLTLDLDAERALVMLAMLRDQGPAQ